MMAGSEKTSRGTIALDLMLQTLMKSKQTEPWSQKAWESISAIVPGSTPKQVQRRFEELEHEYNSKDALMSAPLLRQHLKQNTTRSDLELERPANYKPEKSDGPKQEQGFQRSKSQPSSASSSEYGPTMVIHVCDEAKNLKKDFNCPRDLLVDEMKYFAEYLSTDAQRWEEVDISVHCDVQIFDWLMKYVKRTTKEVKEKPKLEPNNVVSILISSDFLKMDRLVQECVEFCHENMNAVIATPCNMNCIKDEIVARIADLFNHNDADGIKDRKDKFKSKLFSKLTEKLFDSEKPNPCSPENPSTLYSCQVCQRLLTKNLEKKLKCTISRMTVNKKGELLYHHILDPSWDINEYLLELKSKLKSWRNVYWSIWGTVNYLKCSRCSEVFPCRELGQCKYHSEQPKHSGGTSVYPCCQLECLRFDPTEQRKGCRVRDHVVDVKDSDCTAKVYEDLLSCRDAVCDPEADSTTLVMTEDSSLNVFANDELLCGLRSDGVGMSKQESSLFGDVTAAPRLQPLTMEADLMHDVDSETADNTDDEMEEDKGRVYRFKSGQSKQRVTVDPQAILVDAPDFSTATSKRNRWDASKSLRFNQDSQREEDMKRMHEMIRYLTRLRFGADKVEKLKQKEYAGGLFSKLEAQWRMEKPPPQAKGNTGNAPFRSKTRISTARS